MAAPALLPDAPAAAAWLRARVTGSLASDHRRVTAGDGFIAWRGRTHDARRWVGDALQAGAAACLVEADGADAIDGLDDGRVAALAGLHEHAGPVAFAFHGGVAGRLDLVAATGTNGKTSCTWWMAQALAALGRRCGVVGTLGIGVPPDALTAGRLTTPDAIALHGALAGFAVDGFDACAMEASSIGIVEHRLDAAPIRVALLTNFTQDHLDYHGSMQAYWAAKRRLFDWPGLRAAVVNVDDGHGARLAAELAGSPVDLWTVAVEAAARFPARLSAHSIGYRDGALAFDVVEGGASAPVRSRVVGEFNVHNLLVVLGGLRALGVPLVDAARALASVTPVPGRMQRVDGGAGRPAVVVDYAHTPDALDKALAALAPMARAQGGRLWCVFGCGGNRDAAKRPRMAAAAEARADRVVVTSDNPRDEAPAAILADIVAGLARPGAAVVIEDRRDAIAHAIGAAAPADVVLLAGKGHEDYQEVRGERRPFSDVDVAREQLQSGAGERRA